MPLAPSKTFKPSAFLLVAQRPDADLSIRAGQPHAAAALARLNLRIVCIDNKTSY
jgi:hypothetical protein